MSPSSLNKDLDNLSRGYYTWLNLSDTYNMLNIPFNKESGRFAGVVANIYGWNQNIQIACLYTGVGVFIRNRYGSNNWSAWSHFSIGNV